MNDNPTTLLSYNKYSKKSEGQGKKINYTYYIIKLHKIKNHIYIYISIFLKKKKNIIFNPYNYIYINIYRHSHRKLVGRARNEGSNGSAQKQSRGTFAEKKRGTLF